MSKPTVGRIVHYSAPKDGRVRAAIITRVNQNSTVDLLMFDIYGVVPALGVEQSETTKNGHWWWPERVE